MKNKIVKIIFPFFLFSLLGASLNAQTIQINGTVNDEHGKPMVGVVVSSGIGENKAITDYQGQYELHILDKSTEVIFSYIGYESQEITLDGKAEINVELKYAETYDLDEVVHLGFSDQKKRDISGAVSTVTGEEMALSPVANLSMALTGRIPGLYTRETYSEPSRTSTTLRVRGINNIHNSGPLVVIDGIPYNYNSNQLFEYITAPEVESISVLKDAASQALYGIQGANGVIVINTKRGKEGKVRIDVKLDQTFEQISTNYKAPTSGEYVVLRNQASANDNKPLPFTPTQVENFISGENRDLYPDNNWKKLNMKDFSMMQRVNLNLTGGNERAQFFTNVNVMHQNGMWKIDQKEYNPNNTFLWANFRSNVDVKFNEWISTSLNLSGNIKREKIPGSSGQQGWSSGIWYRFFSVPPTVYGPVTPQVIDPESGDVLDPGGGIVVTETEPYPAYGVLNRLGYSNHTVTNIYAQFAIKLNLGFITEGLNFDGTVGYQTNSVNHSYTSQSYAAWIRDKNTDKLSFSPFGTEVDSPLTYSKGSSFYYNLNFRGILDYKRTFGDHRVGAMAYAFYQDLNKTDTGSPGLLPYRRINLGVEATYAFDNRYLAKVNISRSGSEQYSRQNRFTTVPAFSLGWILSNESFMEDVDWLSLLKLRASIGKTATDQSGLGRYTYLDNFTLKRGGTLGGYLQYVVGEGQMANPEIAPEISVKQNYGLDFSLFNNFSFSVDLFREKMTNMVSGGISTTPSYQGIPLGNYPKVNQGKFENKGFEIAAQYAKNINKDLFVSVGGWLAYAKNKIVYNDESERADDYAYRLRQEGFAVGQEFGYIVDKTNGNGFFNSQQEIDNSNLIYEAGTPRVGDLKYFDLNNDGIINDKDVAPLGHGGIPLFNYAFDARIKYRSFDLSVLFQGVGEFWQTNMDNGRIEHGFEGIYSDWHKNAWTPERYANGEKITYPALATEKNANHDKNSFFLEDKSYLRLKNLEVGYTFPGRVSKFIGANCFRVYLSGQNLFTWHNMTTKEFDPELNSHMSIPVYRLYNIGLSIKF